MAIIRTTDPEFGWVHVTGDGLNWSIAPEKWPKYSAMTDEELSAALRQASKQFDERRNYEQRKD